MPERKGKSYNLLRSIFEQRLASLDFLSERSRRHEILDIFDELYDKRVWLKSVNDYVLDHGHSEGSLYERVHILDAFFKYTLTPMVFLDTNFNFIRVNDAYAKGCGREVYEFPGRNHFEMFPHEENKAIFENVVKTKKAYETRGKLFVFPDHPEFGETYWDWNLVPITNLRGEIDFLVFSLKNVTDIKKAEIKIAENEKKYRHLVENANSIIMQRTVDGTITFFNEYAQKFFGYSEHEIIGKNIVGTIIPEKDSSGRDMHELVKQIGNDPEKYVQNENQNICKDGRYVWISWTNKPIIDSDGKVVGLLAVGSDITKRKYDESLIKITNTLLDLFIKKNTLQEYLDSVVKTIRQWSGFECAGVRLKSAKGSLPYISCMGYSGDFLELENNISVEEVSCICARVASGIFEKVDKKISIGKTSFGVNDAQNFMDSLSEKEKEKYWAHCISNGFNSIIIVPIVYHKEVLGLIHLADQEKFKPIELMTELLEPIALLVAEAIHRFDVEKKLFESRERVNTVVSCAPIILFAIDKNGKITLEEGEPLYKIGGNPGSSVGKNFFEVYEKHYDMVDGFKKALRGEISNTVITSFNGFTFDVNFSWVKNRQGQIDGLIGVAVDISEKTKAQHEILDYQVQLRSLTAELVLAEERERRRIAEQLHDCLGPIISHSARQIGIIEKESPANISNSLVEVQEHLHEAVRSTRSLTFNISPPSLYNFGFEIAVEELADEFMKMHNIKVDFECKGEQHFIDEQIQVLIYRSVRELMLNIVKHADVKKAKVVINRNKDSVEIFVIDEGKGFDVKRLDSSECDRGYGLFSVKERVKHIGGFMDIISQPDKGTKVVINIPVTGQ
ncbi:MAG: PAS domain S-box protein [Sedimentisphaeraceae bacterium JB056]